MYDIGILKEEELNDFVRYELNRVVVKQEAKETIEKISEIILQGANVTKEKLHAQDFSGKQASRVREMLCAVRDAAATRTMRLGLIKGHIRKLKEEDSNFNPDAYTLLRIYSIYVGSIIENGNFTEKLSKRPDSVD
jgi:hypothetical protein